MTKLSGILGGFAVSTALALSAPLAIAAPTDPTDGGATTVELAPSFLAALTSLHVTPAAVFPGHIYSDKEGVFARFPITTGEIDLGTVKAEVDHSGGLSLTAGSTVVKLTDFIIDLTGTTPVLTGLVIVDGSLLTRLPLFNLSLAHATVSAKDERVVVGDVAVTLTAGAASALNGVFKITALGEGLAIGTATVRARLGEGWPE